MSRAIKDLHPLVAEKATLFLGLALTKHIELLITSTLRTFDEQADLFALGRTAPGKKVTNAKPGASWHNFGLAFDVVPIVNGKAVWNDNVLWEQIGDLGRQMGLIWGGDFKNFKDKPHFEYHPNLTLVEANDLRNQNKTVLEA